VRLGKLEAAGYEKRNAERRKEPGYDGPWRAWPKACAQAASARGI